MALLAELVAKNVIHCVKLFRIVLCLQNIRAIAEEIGRHKVNLRLALIEYRDHPPQDRTFVTRVLNFTDSLSTMKFRVDASSAQGGN